jgi:hypothetical protein
MDKSESKMVQKSTLPKVRWYKNLLYRCEVKVRWTKVKVRWYKNLLSRKEDGQK